MAYTFNAKKTATVKAKISGTTDSITVAGTNPQETSADNAAAQINKILTAAYGEDDQPQVTARGMTRNKSEEAVEDE